MALTKSLSSELREVAHSFREKITHTEDGIDLMNCFSLAAREIVKKGIKKDSDIRIDDIMLDVDSRKGFAYSERLKSLPEFVELLNGTDVEAQIAHLADTAKHRYKHLNKHPERTNLKIRQR